VSPQPPSLVAERAVRYLRDANAPVSSVNLAKEVLAVRTSDEAQATRVLDTAFAGDPRLVYAPGGWRPAVATATAPPSEASAAAAEPDVVFLLVEAAREAPRARLVLTAVAVARRRGDAIVAATGGELARWSPPHALRDEIRRLLRGARPIVHAPPGGLAALEEWLDEPLDDPLPLPLLGRRRTGIAGGHTAADLAARLKLSVRVDDDASARIELVAACFDALRRPGESWADLQKACRGDVHAVPWSRYAFTPDDLRGAPPHAGTYRFFDADGRLIYVGKSRNLKRRLATWFRDDASRTSRARAIVDAVHRLEIQPAGSELEALLREAAQIARESPRDNVQRRVRASTSRAQRLTSILILEPAETPWVLRAWLIREGNLLDAVPLGPRGGGLKRIARILESEFFSPRSGPRSLQARPVDVELIARWLSEHRDRAVAFDPTHLRTTDEVIARLQWFLDRRELSDGDGSPILPRG
jgi:hypothetical protein